VPELPEVESVRRSLEPSMAGASFETVLVRRPNLRTAFPDRFGARLTGQRVLAVLRRAKYLLVPLSSGDTLLMHLGMSGWIRIDAPPADSASSIPPAADPDPHDHVVFELSSGAIVTFNDPRRFGVMDLLSPEALASHPALRTLGPEPLSAEFDAVALARACRGKKTSLKAALLDQRVVAGLGNIYVSEALHRARLSPTRRASTIATPRGAPRDMAVALVAAIKQVLTEAIARTVDPRAYRTPRFRVYDREGQRCRRPRCGGMIRRRTQAGRSTFYCAVCQR
jgi:formamidopyrimidine-DNA glycosylase